MKKELKRIPKFKSKKEEIDFWEKADTSDYFDFEKAKKANFPNLSPSTKQISIRLSQEMLDDLKSIANRIDVPYQSLIKVFLREKIQEEKNKKAG